MRKAASILFFILYLVSTSQLVELLKIPVLVEHFQEHQKENKSITILQFLDEHYMHGCPRDADYDRDMQLPFKLPVHPVLASVSYTLPVPLAVTPEIAIGETRIDYPKISSRYSYEHLSSIWQPPDISQSIL
ncbi:hypothetical protein QTN47_25610 [Danxiaibacter flavus]|uniref:Uncharacterized protein n=1 Tax=Danxiaibacter flavus TaxID=3049108 RepID=A0ABV3ZM05_9BACT|nr:hypothetical protein QNM32_25610 [Chitinophagaceae bacterium DXS]